MENNRRKWSFSKEVSIGDAIGLAVAFTAVLVAYGALKERVALVEQTQTSQASMTVEWRDRVENSIQEINRKLERLIERNSNERRR